MPERQSTLLERMRESTSLRFAAIMAAGATAISGCGSETVEAQPGKTPTTTQSESAVQSSTPEKSTVKTPETTPSSVLKSAEIAKGLEAIKQKNSPEKIAKMNAEELYNNFVIKADAPTIDKNNLPESYVETYVAYSDAKLHAGMTTDEYVINDRGSEMPLDEYASTVTSKYLRTIDRALLGQDIQDYESVKEFHKVALDRFQRLDGLHSVGLINEPYQLTEELVPDSIEVSNRTKDSFSVVFTTKTTEFDGTGNPVSNSVNSQLKKKVGINESIMVAGDISYQRHEFTNIHVDKDGRLIPSHIDGDNVTDQYISSK